MSARILAARACIVLLCESTLIPGALACGYDGLLGNGISQSAPGSIDVAIALQQGVADGLLKAELVSPDFKKDLFATGYNRAVHHLQDLRGAVEEARGHDRDAAPAFSLLFVEASLWSRFAPTASGEVLSVHQPAASPGDQIVVTGEAVIEAIAGGRLSVDDAFRRKLIVVSAEADTGPAVTALLRQALESLSSSAAGDITGSRS